jgi:hypothetical protein
MSPSGNPEEKSGPVAVCASPTSLALSYPPHPFDGCGGGKVPARM